MGFMENLKKEQNNRKTLTENFAVAYETTGSDLLDFNFKITSFRKYSDEDIIKSFQKVFYDDNILALKYLFYVGDIRQGLGERRVFKVCFAWVAKSHPDQARRLLKIIPEYSRWDILISLVDCSEKLVKREVINIIRNQLRQDKFNMLNNKPISLMAKWLPSENTSSKDTRLLARQIMSELKMSPKKYRKTLSALRSYLDVVEVKMSSKSWDEIDYSTVPSVANLRYSDAFLRNDKERRVEYLESLKSGKTKINAGVLQPHEIVYKYTKGYDIWSNNYYTKFNDTLEELWKALPDICTEETLVVRDGSGSMYCGVSGKVRAVDVATALAIYCSEHTTGEFNDKFITFSSNPRLVDLRGCKNLADKIDVAFNETEMSNTNIYKTMQLILTTAIKNNMRQEELPKNILIVSDMQFDGTRFHLSRSLFEDIQKEFEIHGYKLPRICFWNLCPYDSKTIPIQQNDMGLILCSGFSVNNLKMFMSGEIDPLKILLEVIESRRYAIIDKILSEN